MKRLVDDLIAAGQIPYVYTEGKICGGFNDKLLVSGTPEQVKDEVKRVLDICAPGGGYMFDVNATIDSDVKPENMEAMFDTVKTYGKY